MKPGRSSHAKAEAQPQTLVTRQHSSPWNFDDELKTLNDRRPLPLRQWQGKEQSGAAGFTNEGDSPEAKSLLNAAEKRQTKLEFSD
jgi:hypothetical protein